VVIQKRMGRIFHPVLNHAFYWSSRDTRYLT